VLLFVDEKKAGYIAGGKSEAAIPPFCDVGGSRDEGIALWLALVEKLMRQILKNMWLCGQRYVASAFEACDQTLAVVETIFRLIVLYDC